MDKPEYAAYLKTEHWQTMRRLALDAAEGRCQVCNGTEQCDVHHRSYDNIGREKLNDLCVLCRKHHGMAHDIAEASAGVPEVAASIWSGFSGFADARAMLCPVCWDACQHPVEVSINAGGALTLVTYHGIRKRKTAAEGRGVVVRITFECEEGHRWVLRWRFHKGVTYWDVEEKGEWEDGGCLTIWRG